MNKLELHLIESKQSIRLAMQRINELAQDGILFVIDENSKLVGSLTDGDIRRGLLAGKNMEDKVEEVCFKQPKFIQKSIFFSKEIKSYRQNKFGIIPIVDDEHQIIDLINFRFKQNELPVFSVIMAGGKGERLKPLTLNTPKPLLQIGSKPILKYNLELLQRFGVKNCCLSINYLGEQLEIFANENSNSELAISTIKENEPLGTIGSLSLIDNFPNDYLLVSNSDLLSNVNLEDFFIDFVDQHADLSVLSIPYSINVPYAILSTENDTVKGLSEKPTYTYFANGGMYLFKKEMIKLIPKNTFFTAVDFIEELLRQNKKVITYVHNGYWLDIGQHEDYKRANEDIKHLNLWE